MKDTTRKLVARLLVDVWAGRYSDDAGNFYMVEFTHDLMWIGDDAVPFLLERGYIATAGKIEVYLEKTGSTTDANIYDLTDSGQAAAERCMVAMATALQDP